jgi:hypothetical protein
MASSKFLVLAALAVALTVGTGGAQTRSDQVFLR